MKAKHILVVSVGPVQEFIASARRSRDLWFGSWLLSELSKAAALEIAKQHGDRVDCLIFPAPHDMEELKSEAFNVPNKIVAVVEQSPKDLESLVRKAIEQRLGEIREEAYKNVNGDFLRDIAKQQVDEMIECFCVGCPVNGNYKEARGVAESLLAARKTTRDFPKVGWELLKTPKSSLDGQRESVIPEKAYDEMTRETLRKQYGVRPGERLCGVGLLKRHGKRGREARFVSTSHMAATPLLQRLKDETPVTNYTNTLEKLGASDALGTSPMNHPVFGHNDGQLLFEERLADYFEDKTSLNAARKAMRDFLETAFDEDKPSPYYALLLADGDNMGKAIDAQDDEPKHRALSQTLSKFAQNVENTVKESQGWPIYSGGDDVLAFLPLHTALDCAAKLKSEFDNALNNFKFNDDGTPRSPTLSVGIAVVHHLEPLSDALNLAREAEKAAKSVHGKNALAVLLSKRGGSDRIVKDSWSKLKPRLDDFIKLHVEEKISHRAAYELQGIALRLSVNPSETEYSILQDAMKKEAVRILFRKQTSEGKTVDKSVVDDLTRSILTGEVSVSDLADELIVAREFAAAKRLSQPPKGATP